MAFLGTVQVFCPFCLFVCCVASSVSGVPVCLGGGLLVLIGWLVVCACILVVPRSVLWGTLGVLWPYSGEYSGTTLGVPWDYCASILGVLPQYSGSTDPVLWEYCTSTLGLPWEYCASTLGVLCKYWPSPLLGHHTHQQFQQVPSFDNHTAGHTYTEQVCSAKYCRTAFLKIWIFKNLILSIF